MTYLICRRGDYYFNRRVPLYASAFDPRKTVRAALKTDSLKEAHRLAERFNDKLEQYWQQLIATGQKHDQHHYKQVAERARLLGFDYVPAAELAAGPIEEIVRRVLHVFANFSEKHAEAVLGTVPEPAVTLSDALKLYWGLTKEKILTKTPHQLRKWRNQKERAIKYFIKCVGDKPVQQLTRADALKFKDHWIERIEKEDLGLNGANKNFNDLRVILETVSDNYHLNLDIQHVFGKLNFEEDKQSDKASFSTDYIRNTLLNPENLSGMNEAHKAILHIIAETGAGVTELIAIRPQEIFLDHSVPHIAIAKYKKNSLKTKFRKRTIPLVGYALDAFRNYPHGFSQLFDNPSSVSAAIGKYLRENKLLPTDKYTVNSLRHSFQDRLLKANAPDRVQADLMGHKYNRQAYGYGADLEQKFDWLVKIQLKHL